MKKKLTELLMQSLDEVSLVDEGAGIDVPIKIIKRSGKMKFSVLKKLFKKAMEEEEKGLEALQAILDKLPPEEAAIIMEALASAAEMPAEEEKAEGDEEEKAVGEEEEKAADEEEKADGEDEEKAMDEEEKAMDEEKAEGEEEEKALAKRLINENKKLQKKLNELSAVAFRKAVIAKAEKWQHLPGATKDEFVKAMVEVSKAGLKAETVATLEKIFEKSNEIIKRSALMNEFGSSLGGTDAEAEFASKVKKARSDNPGMTKAAAATSVLEADPALYNRLNKK